MGGRVTELWTPMFAQEQHEALSFSECRSMASSAGHGGPLLCNYRVSCVEADAGDWERRVSYGESECQTHGCNHGGWSCWEGQVKFSSYSFSRDKVRIACTLSLSSKAWKGYTVGEHCLLFDRFMLGLALFGHTTLFSLSEDWWLLY